MEKKSVPVFCKNEGKQVGTLELIPGVAKITTTTFMNSFVPMSPDYRFAAGAGRDYKSATCAKCGGILGIKTDEKPESPKLKEARQQARDRAKVTAQQMTTGPRGQNLSAPVGRSLESKSSEDEIVGIVLGRTTLKIE